MFTDDDVKQHRRVVVLGPTVVTNLFSGADPVGSSVRINGTQFQVVGVTESKGSNGVQDQDDVALAPLTAVQDAITRLRERAQLDHGRGAATAARWTPRRPR